MSPIKHLLVIAGPTAVGKTVLSIQLAKHFGTEIISADSRQFYTEMTIGTAKPSQDDMQGIPHHFINSLSIHQNYTAGDFEKDVLQKLDELYKKHKLVILCGGSGLFIDAVCKGFDKGLPSDAKVKKNIREQYEQKGINWLQQEVKNKDALYYSRADVQNPHRLMRALEVITLSGKPYSSFRKNEAQGREFTIMKVLINEDRNVLYDKINHRVDDMMQKGFMEEARQLHPYKDLNALNTVGYKELFDYLDGKISFEKAVELVKQHTRNYAKRQLTWFNKDKEYTPFLPGDLEKIKSFVEIIMQHT